MAMIDDTLGELKSGIEKAKEALKRDLTKLRTGRAHAGMVDFDSGRLLRSDHAHPSNGDRERP